MLTILFAVAIAGMAEREKRNPWIWGSLTALLSAGIQTLLLPGYWGAVLGLILAFAAMTWANFKYPVKKGVMLDPE